MFFYTGNEGAIEGFYDNTGFLFELAQNFSALIVFAEHVSCKFHLPLIFLIIVISWESIFCRVDCVFLVYTYSSLDSVHIIYWTLHSIICVYTCIDIIHIVYR